MKRFAIKTVFCVAISASCMPVAHADVAVANEGVPSQSMAQFIAHPMTSIMHFFRLL